MKNTNTNRSIMLYSEVPSGETVWNGFIGGETTCTAPSEPNGLWNLYEIVSASNNHIGWHWEFAREA